MDRDAIIRLAKDAGLPTAWISDSGVLTWFDLEHFAALVAAHEREECAKVCEEFCDDPYAVLTAERIRRRNQE